MTYNAITSNDYSNLNQPKAEEIQSVSYAINVTVVEPAAINYAQNITPLDSSYSYFPTVGSSLINFATNVTALDSHGFEWSASDNASDMNYMSVCNTSYNPLLWLIPCCLPLIPLAPCIIYELYERVASLKSQKLKVTDSHVDFEHLSLPRCCCCLFSNPPTETYHIRLKDIRSISYFKHKQQLDINYFKGARTNKQSTIKIRGLLESSNSVGLIKDAIIEKRPKQLQTIRYTIPHITNTYKSQTITLNPHHNTVDYKGKEKETVAFIDGLGSIYVQGSNSFADSRLEFWSPPICSGDGPEMTTSFPDDRSCLAFKRAVESSRNSLYSREHRN
jgi:hypothetical protein